MRLPISDRKFSALGPAQPQGQAPKSAIYSWHGVILTPEGLHGAAPFHHARRRNDGVAACFVRSAAWQDGADRISGLRVSCRVRKIRGSLADRAARSRL